jgi:hypothetical protein
VSALASTQREFIGALYSEAPCDAGIEVYRRNMLANLCGALGTTFPVVKRLVGDAFFREMARRFVFAHPSQSGDLNEFGEGFAEFIAAYPHAQGLAYLADVARLEWACHESEQAADGGSLDFAELATVPPEAYPRIRFALHPAVRLVRSESAIEAIWSANQPDRDGTPDRAEGPDCVVVSREQGSVRVETFDRVPWEFLAALARGASLAEASEVPGAAEFIATGLAALAGRGLIAGFSLGESPA